MLETSIERVKLLKAGISGKKIEELYISRNKIKIVNSPLLQEHVEIHKNKINSFVKDQEAIAEMCF